MEAILFTIGFCLVIVGVVSYVLYTHRDRSVPLGYGNSKVVLTTGVTVDMVKRALEMAVNCLLSYSHLPENQIHLAAQNLYLVVLPVDVIKDSYGRMVGGESIPGSSEVGKDLSTICHELAHVVEYRITFKANDTHTGWEENGIFPADRAYRAQLEASKSS